MIRWEGAKYELDWRMDGYCWRQTRGKATYSLQNQYLFPEHSEDFKREEKENRCTIFSRSTFKLRINCGKTAESFTTQFNKTVFHHKEYPNQILVIYEGDASCINKEYSHGNAKRP